MGRYRDRKTCWQCSEHNINFTYVINTITELSEHSITTTLKNIKTRLKSTCHEGIVTRDLLEDILDYSVKNGYVVKYTMTNEEESYNIQEMRSKTCFCSLCGEILKPYLHSEFVGIDTFRTYVNDVKDLKDYINIELAGKYDSYDGFLTNVGVVSVVSIDDDISTNCTSDLEDYKQLINRVRNKGSETRFLLEFLHDKYWYLNEEDLTRNLKLYIDLEKSTNLDTTSNRSLGIRKEENYIGTSTNKKTIDDEENQSFSHKDITELLCSVENMYDEEIDENNDYPMSKDTYKSLEDSIREYIDIGDELVENDTNDKGEGLLDNGTQDLAGGNSSILENVIKNKISGSSKNFSWNMKLCDYYGDKTMKSNE